MRDLCVRRAIQVLEYKLSGILSTVNTSENSEEEAH